jgi:ankyrin repeat domain-containing protein 50
MEPLSALGVASGVAGIISLGISVCDDFLGYYRSCKNARADSARLFRSMERLATILKDLERTIEKPILKHTGFAATETHIIACRQGIDTLQSELERISATSKSQYKFWTKARQRALYPFKERTLLNLTGIVDQLVEYLGLAVGTLNL